MNLVWKILRQHISFPQFAGFLLANFSGMLVVLFGYQFYNDVLPVFTRQDTFLKSDYLVVSKRIGVSTTISGSDNTFTEQETEELSRQEFSKKVGRFTSAEYKVYASMGIQGQNILNSEIFLESVPDSFVDVPKSEWIFDKDTREVPVLLPQSYINVYNFGFAESHSLPKISTGVTGAVDLTFFIHSQDGRDVKYKGRVIGFSNRHLLNGAITVLPQARQAVQTGFFLTSPIPLTMPSPSFLTGMAMTSIPTSSTPGRRPSSCE